MTELRTTEPEPTLAEMALDVCDREDETVAFVRELFTRLGDKWSLRTLDELTGGPVRFTALLRSIPGISHRMLTVTLRSLETDGLVGRAAYPETPPRVEYSITPLGESLLRHALVLVGWSQDHKSEIEFNRSIPR